MNEKKYRLILAVLVVAVAIVNLAGIYLHNFLIPVIAVVMGILLAVLFRNQLKDVVVEDERARFISAVSARSALTIFCNFAAIAGITLVVLNKNGPEMYRVIGYTLCYSVCVLLLIDLVIYFYLDRKQQA